MEVALIRSVEGGDAIAGDWSITHSFFAKLIDDEARRIL